IMVGYPDFEQYATVVGVHFSIAHDLYHGKRARYLWGLLPGFKGYDRAVIMYETMVANAPYSEYAPMALMKAAELHLKLNNDIYAVDTLDRLINSYPDSMLTGDAYLLLAKTFAKLVDGPHYDQGATREAISYFEDFLILFPDHPKIKEGEDGLDRVRSIQAQSKMVKGDFYFYKWKDFRAAKVFYNEAITVAPNSPEAKIAQVQLAQVDERIQNRIEQYERENSLVPSSRREGLAEQLQREAGFIPSSDSQGVEDPTEF
ncbi:MAG: tetratricopeptide repeat protein, partial [Opitutae bacterium]|nr:tetratricopeptide repeat protein [Opitutae bacterium]